MPRNNGDSQAPHVALRPVVFLTVGLWLTVYVYFTARSYFLVPNFWENALARGLNCLFAIVLTGGLYYLLRQIQTRRFLALFTIVVVASLITAGIYAVFAAITYETLAGIPGEEPISLWRAVLERSQASPWVFLAWCSGYLAMEYNGRLQTNEMRLIEAQSLAADAQNRMLRYQIQPHFLFNTLTAISTLILRKENKRAERMVIQLSKFLRHSLEASPEAQVPLREEIEAQELYLAIEQERFGERLRFEKRLDADLDGLRVPSLILQPLIENSVRHAVAHTDRPVTVAIAARRLDGEVLIEVVDDGPGDPEKTERGLGVGLENVRRRLAVIYGPGAVFEHGPQPGGGYASRLVLPADAA